MKADSNASTNVPRKMPVNYATFGKQTSQTTPASHSSEKYCSNNPRLIVSERIPVECFVGGENSSSIEGGVSISTQGKPVEN
jgi:hypothetical protein